MERGRYDSAMFWLAFGTAAAVVGIAFMTIGVSRSAPAGNLLASMWFDVGLLLLALGGLLLLWALLLYLMRRRAAVQAHATSGPPAFEPDKDVEAVRGYYAERGRMLKIWDRSLNRKSGKGVTDRGD